jgi:hypothetical protein
MPPEKLDAAIIFAPSARYSGSAPRARQRHRGFAAEFT